MNKKEKDVQKALGTLPLWEKIELGDADFEEHPLTYVSGNGDSRESSGPTIQITFVFSDRSKYIEAYYNKNIRGDRKKAIKRIARKAKKLGLKEEEE